MSSGSSLTAADVKRKAAEIGFDACGVAPAAAHPELTFFDEWISRGYAGEMTYLARSAADRADIHRVMPSVRSVIATATLYNTNRPYSTQNSEHGRAHVARYAWGDDYHAVITGRLNALLSWMHKTSPQEFQACVYVDTGPIQERVFAQHAGIGWIGKNSCVINPALGSWLFLGEILCSLPLSPDVPALDQCGTCTLCIDGCPTQAIVGPGVLDATRCISYLTIEKPGEMPADLSAGVGTHIYGCDVCQEVCPWNQSAPTSSDPAWQPRPIWDARTVGELAESSDAELRAGLRGSSMDRAKLSGLRRNLGVALENSADGG